MHSEFRGFRYGLAVVACGFMAAIMACFVVMVVDLLAFQRELSQGGTNLCLLGGWFLSCMGLDYFPRRWARIEWVMLGIAVSYGLLFAFAGFALRLWSDLWFEVPVVLTACLLRNSLRRRSLIVS